MQQIEVSNKEYFASNIRTIARNNNLDLVEAITSFCEDNEYQMEDIIPLLDKNLREEIKVDAIAGRYIRGFKIPKTLF